MPSMLLARLPDRTRVHAEDRSGRGRGCHQTRARDAARHPTARRRPTASAATASRSGPRDPARAAGPGTSVTPHARSRIERDGWSVLLAPALAELPSKLGLELMERVFKIAEGAGGEPLRRSRHASTYQIRLGTPLSVETEVFVKLLDAPRGLKAARRLFLRSRG